MGGYYEPLHVPGWQAGLRRLGAGLLRLVLDLAPLVPVYAIVRAAHMGTYAAIAVGATCGALFGALVDYGLFRLLAPPVRLARTMVTAAIRAG